MFQVGQTYSVQSDDFYSDVWDDFQDSCINAEDFPEEDGVVHHLMDAGYGSGTGGIEFAEGTQFLCVAINEAKEEVILQPANTQVKLIFYYNDPEVLELFGVKV